MAIQRPEPVLLHNVPLKFVRERVSGHGRKSVDHQIPLIPFIDFLIVLVIFLLMSFSASGELVGQWRQGFASPRVTADGRIVAVGENLAESGNREITNLLVESEEAINFAPSIDEDLLAPVKHTVSMMFNGENIFYHSFSNRKCLLYIIL